MVLFFALLGAVPAAAAWADGLYEARTIVTGMDQRSRPAGLRQVLGLVLAKVSGVPGLATDPRLDAVDPVPLLEAFAYLDRMSDIPKHDEQGSRDRPYDLVARFRRGGIDAQLRAWGESPWPVPRPAVLVEVTVVPRDGAAFAMHADTDVDERHRAALLAAADRFGLEVVVPAALNPVPPPAGMATLHGALRWSDVDAGWVATWRLEAAGARQEWGIEGVSFDAAYRDGIGGAAQRLRTPNAGSN